jgi:transposase
VKGDPDVRLTFVWWPSIRRFCTASKTEPIRGPQPQLSDEQWAIVEDLFPWDPPSAAGGRPRVLPRPCLEGILWVLRTGARWKDLPRTFPSYPTCWRRLKEWAESGVFEKAWARSLRKLDGLGRVDWEETFADGTFAPAKKGGDASARPNAARAPS